MRQPTGHRQPQPGSHALRRLCLLPPNSCVVLQLKISPGLLLSKRGEINVGLHVRAGLSVRLGPAEHTAELAPQRVAWR
jgi:hypothetical protein